MPIALPPEYVLGWLSWVGWSTHIRDAADVAFRVEAAGYLLPSQAAGRHGLAFLRRAGADFEQPEKPAEDAGRGA